MKPQVYHVDAFTSQPFRGNSAGVVFPADNLSEAQMQLIARELGHSETAFLLHSDDSDVRIRYFTPTVEVPIRDNQPEKVTISGTAVILFHAEWAIDF